jgi:hypothetical protein
VATDDDELATRIRGLMMQGISTDAHERDVGGRTRSYDVTLFGHKRAMSDLRPRLDSTRSPGSRQSSLIGKSSAASMIASYPGWTDL